LAGYECFYHYSKYYESSKKWQKIQDNISKYDAYELKDNEAKHFPWAKEPTL